MPPEARGGPTRQVKRSPVGHYKNGKLIPQQGVEQMSLLTRLGKFFADRKEK
jgi:hypothetical protein